LDHLEKLRLALPPPSLFMFLLEQSRVKFPGESDVTKATYPFDAFLEETGDLALPKGVHQFARRMMGANQLYAVDEPVQFLKYEKKIELIQVSILTLW